MGPVLNQLSLALTDSLTGLHNRRYLDSHLLGVTRRAAENNHPVPLLMIDIDRFKGVNDTRGHADGDSMLSAVAERLRERMGKTWGAGGGRRESVDGDAEYRRDAVTGYDRSAGGVAETRRHGP